MKNDSQNKSNYSPRRIIIAITILVFFCLALLWWQRVVLPKNMPENFQVKFTRGGHAHSIEYIYHRENDQFVFTVNSDARVIYGRKGKLTHTIPLDSAKEKKMYELVKEGNVFSLENEYRSDTPMSGGGVTEVDIKASVYHQHIDIFDWESAPEVIHKMRNIYPLHVSKIYDKFRTDLMNNAERGNLQEVRTLVNEGAQINKQDELLQWTALMYAIEAGKQKVALYLVDKGAEVNVQGKRGLTPLMLALDKKSFDTTRALLEAGANVNVKDQEGETPLMYGVKTDTKTVKLLLKAGADPAARSDAYRTKGDYLHVIDYVPGDKPDIERMIEEAVNESRE